MKITGRVVICLVVLCSALLPSGARTVLAQSGLAWADSWVADSAFYDVWSRGDAPVAMRAVARSWLWGPVPFAVANEEYAESATARRLVTYLDKGRMEVNDPSVDRTSQWFVTSGLLVKEMVTGQLQTGNNSFEKRTPADVPVAGDLGNVTAPTYATFAGHTAPVPSANGAIAQEGIARDGSLFPAPPGATLPGSKLFNLVSFDEVTGHNIPGVFLNWMRQNGTVLEGGRLVQGPLLDPLYVLGRPLTEAYWADVPVNGAPVRVLVQLFERRALTYNPANPPEWQVEMANVGRSYFEWRYGGKALEPAISAELRQNTVYFRGWNWPEGKSVQVQIDLAGGIAPLAGPVNATPDQSGQFSATVALNSQLQGALASHANVTVSATAGEIRVALPFAASASAGKVTIEGSVAQVLPSSSGVPRVTVAARDGRSWSFTLDVNSKVTYSEGAPAALNVVQPSMAVSVEGTAIESNVTVSALRLLSVSKVGAKFGYTVQSDGKGLQISGTGWPGEKGVAFSIRTLADNSAKSIVTLTADSRGNLLGSVPLPARSALPSGALWLFAVSSDKGAVVAQVALPFDYPASAATRPPTLIALGSGGEQTGGVGSYCWQTMCVDTIGVPLPSDALQVAAGEVVGLRSQYGPDPNAGLSPSAFSARVFPYPDASSGQGTLLDGVFYFAPKGAPVYTTGNLPGRPFSISLPASLPAGKYAVLAGVTWPDPGGGGTVSYGFTIEIGK